MRAVRRLLDLEVPAGIGARWKKLLYWILWLAMAGIAAWLLLAVLNGAQTPP